MGVFLGILERSDEPIFWLCGSIMKARDFRRVPPSDQWSTVLVQAIDRLECRPNGETSDEMRIHSHARRGLDVPRPPTAPGDGGEPRRQRSMNLRKATLAEYGYTDGCLGCEAAMRGARRIPRHWVSCRDRIVRAMEQTEDGRERLQRDRERFEANAEANAEAPAANAEPWTATPSTPAEVREAEEELRQRRRRIETGKTSEAVMPEPVPADDERPAKRRAVHGDDRISMGDFARKYVSEGGDSPENLRRMLADAVVYYGMPESHLKLYLGYEVLGQRRHERARREERQGELEAFVCKELEGDELLAELRRAC